MKKRFKFAERVSRSVELNEGDPILVEVQMSESKNVYRYLGRYIEVPEFKNSCLSKDLRIVTQDSLLHFSQGHAKHLCDFKIIKGSKKVWLLTEKDVKEDYSRGFDPEMFRDWRKVYK